MSWKLNVGDIHNLKPIQNKNYALGVLRNLKYTKFVDEVLQRNQFLNERIWVIR